MGSTDGTGNGRPKSTIQRIEFPLSYAPGTVAGYILPGDDPILIDAGSDVDGAWDALVSGLAACGLTPDDVAHVVLTHSHNDHIGQAGRLAELGATIAAPRGVRDRLAADEGDRLAAVQEAAAAIGLDDEEAAEYREMAVGSLRRNRRLLPPDRIDREFETGRLQIGEWAFDVVHTPGHQDEHVVLFADGPDGDEVLFSGDALIETFRAAACNVGLDPRAFEAIGAYYAGYERLERALQDRRVGTVYPGHGPVFDRCREVLANSISSLDGLVDGVERVLPTDRAITPRRASERYWGTDEETSFFRLLDVVGTLGYLAETDRVLVADASDAPRRFRRGPAAPDPAERTPDSG